MSMIKDGAVLVFKNRGTGTVLDLTASKSDNGTLVIGYKYHGGKNQQWRLEKKGSNGPWPYYMIKCVATGTVIDLDDGKRDSGTKVQGWKSMDNNKNQLWRFIQSDPTGNVVMIQNIGSGTFIDLFHGDANNSAKIVGWDSATPGWSENNHQLWVIEKASS